MFDAASYVCQTLFTSRFMMRRDPPKGNIYPTGVTPPPLVSCEHKNTTLKQCKRLVFAGHGGSHRTHKEEPPQRACKRYSAISITNPPSKASPTHISLCSGPRCKKLASPKRPLFAERGYSQGTGPRGGNGGRAKAERHFLHAFFFGPNWRDGKTAYPRLGALSRTTFLGGSSRTKTTITSMAECSEMFGYNANEHM